MTMHASDIPSELEIIAYADGRLDDQPAVKAAFEERLAHYPDVYARAMAYRAQTTALRQAYAARAEELPPSRLLAALDAPPRRRGKAVARVAAGLLVVLTASTLGWYAGQRGDDQDAPLESFIAESRSTFLAERDGLGASDEFGDGGALSWLSREVSVNFAVPDLSEFGYSVAERDVVSHQGGRMVEIVYRRNGGELVSLFLKPR